MIAQSWSDPPSRHEMDDLFSIACAAALGERGARRLPAPCPRTRCPLEMFGNLVANARANGTQVIVDLSPPHLNSALEGGPSVVKLNDWQLAEYAQDDMTDPDKLRAGSASACWRRGARAVLVTRGGDPALVLRGDGCLGAACRRGSREARPRAAATRWSARSAAALARGFELEEALRSGAAAGATNFLRHGLGTGSRDVVADLVQARRAATVSSRRRERRTTGSPSRIARGPSLAIQSRCGFSSLDLGEPREAGRKLRPGGRPCEECASEPSRCTSPCRASSSSVGEAGPSATSAAVAWISAPLSTSAASWSKKSTPA